MRLGFLIWPLITVLVLTGAAAAVELDGQLVQGGLVIGRTTPGATIALDGRPVRVDAASGAFAIGFGRDHGPSAKLIVRLPDGTRQVETLAIAARDYDIQRIDGLPPRQVTPNTLDLERIRREGALISAARARDGAETTFLAGFAWPVIGRISGVYGSQRILNGEPRRPHLGLDIAAPVGTPVHAAAAGSVTLAEADLFYTGGTVILDHGHGVTTIYSHLDRVDVAAGAIVAQGTVIGTLGATGRATGPHLDWRINWFQTRLDPRLVVGPMPGGS